MIIGLSGYARSGKDYLANILVEKYGFERRAFADKIRDVLYDMNPPLPYNAGWGESHVMLKDIVDRYDWEGAKGSTTIRDRKSTRLNSSH